MNEVNRLKNWLDDHKQWPLTTLPDLRRALWDRRDNLLFRQGFISGAAVASVVAGIIIAIIITN